jgi:hypothetical protein
LVLHYTVGELTILSSDGSVVTMMTTGKKKNQRSQIVLNIPHIHAN